MNEYTFYIDGERKHASGKETRVISSAFDGSKIGAFSYGSLEDVRRAIASANASFAKGDWVRAGIAERAAALRKLHAALQKNADSIAEIEALNIGILRQYAQENIKEALTNFENYLHIAQDFLFASPEKSNYDENNSSIVKREPYGVCALIIPWNYPFLIAVNKLLPALLAGNSVVLKPSPYAPCSCFLFGELLHQIGFPKGVVNIINVDDEAAGELTIHPDVQLVSFTGSFQTAKRVHQNASTTFKKLVLECGGNSAHIVLPEKDFNDIILPIMIASFAHAGQVCVAGRRLLLHASTYDDNLKKLQFRTRFIKYVEGIDEQTNYFPIEPLINHAHLGRVDNLVKKGVVEGAKVLCGGKPAAVKNGGCYYEPTILTDITPDMEIFSEEIFGPVMQIYRYDSIGEAIEIANNSPYGLTAAVWGDDEKAVDEMVDRLETQGVYINTTPFEAHNDNAPFGGFKCSGLGLENGKYGIAEFLRCKHILKRDR